MKIVVKIGGAAIEDAAILHACAEAFSKLSRDGHQVLIVHGGGKKLSETLHRLGIQSEFVDGLRVTTIETRDVALMVLAGLVNKKLVAALQDAGVPALGLCGGDGRMLQARKKVGTGRDLGFVGEIAKVDTKWISAIWKNDGVPVLASVAADDAGEYYNINADEMASACAVAGKADLLIFLTDVAGVKNSAGEVILSISTAAISELIASSVVTGGMLPKLDACINALNHGVGRVHILAAAESKLLAHLAAAKGEAGTEITRSGALQNTRQPDPCIEGVEFEYSAAK